MPERTSVKSTMIHSLEYDHDSRTLTVYFNSGKSYRYANVSIEDYYALVSADSVGKHFNDHIKGIYNIKE